MAAPVMINDPAKAKEMEESIEPSSIMRHVLKYFILYIIVAGLICYFNVGRGLF